MILQRQPGTQIKQMVKIMSKPSEQLILPLADLILDALDADILEVDLLRVVALYPLLKFYEVLKLQLVLLLEVMTDLLGLLRWLLLGLLLELAVESRQLWDFLGFFADRLEEFAAVEGHSSGCDGFLFLLVWTVGQMLDPKAVLLCSWVEVSRGIHASLGVGAGRAVIEAAGLPEGLLGELFLGCPFGERVVLVVHRILVTFLVDLSDLVVSAGRSVVSGGSVDLIQIQVLLLLLGSFMSVCLVLKVQLRHVLRKSHALCEGRPSLGSIYLDVGVCQHYSFCNMFICLNQSRNADADIVKIRLFYCWFLGGKRRLVFGEVSTG